MPGAREGAAAGAVAGAVAAEGWGVRAWSSFMQTTPSGQSALVFDHPKKDLLAAPVPIL